MTLESIPSKPSSRSGIRASAAFRKARERMLAVLVGSVMLAARMSRGVSGPIREVADAVLRIGHGALHERLAVRGGGSLRRLAVGVNDMAARLEHAHDDMRRQVTDATAELRARTLEAEQANVAKSRFLAAASHDLR